MPIKTIHRGVKGGMVPEIIPSTNSNSNFNFNFDSISYNTYAVILILFIIGFIASFNLNIPLIGLLILYFVNIVYTLTLSKDVLNSPKADFSSTVSFLVIAVLVLNIVSSTMMINTLRKLHAIFLKKKDTVKLSDKNRKKLSLYVALWIVSLVSLTFIMAFYFIEPVSEPFFNYMFVDKELSPVVVLAGFVFKIVCIVASLTCASYMMYIADKFYSADRKTL
jgi:NADH:ubiquinone oxidoreductase subunit 5 (subunit L)/multisubunit Na+/H+ antiporter MnhA subunit